MQNNEVFSRTHSDGQILSPNIYNLAIGMTLGWGFLANYLIVKTVPVESLLFANPILFFLGSFACAMAGVFIFNKSDKPAVSFLGYNLVVLPFGLLVAMAVGIYTGPRYEGLVLETIQTTGFVTLAMMILGSMFPAFFQKIVGTLTVALFAVILVEFIGGVFFGWNHGATDWIVVLIFCGYIGYDWGRANAIPKTLDNAIDSAAALYMDIINLFLRLLRILGRRR
ncbi:MAG: Bax inhibitor-1 family protein [Candidatus Latescibacterota bacterium]|jgi:FtsH-binding integral membrane protein